MAVAAPSRAHYDHLRVRTRFAPSPSGLLHVGNGYSALLCQQWSHQVGGELLLRNEDIDFSRCRPHFVTSLMEDLHWLGVDWHGEVRKQSARILIYQQRLEQLQMRGLLYPCFCTRKELMRGFASAPHQMLAHYPGTCRDLSPTVRSSRMADQPYCWRLNMAFAAQQVGQQLIWHDLDGGAHPFSVETEEDVVLARKDIGVSYHLAVVVDDAEQGIDVVIRGEDLVAATPVQRVLQALLGLATPHYSHHPLVRDGAGKRLAKRDGSTTLRGLKERGVRPQRLAEWLLRGASQPLLWDEEVLQRLLG
ncbi:MAG: tRNA glutamyl-Q(34) synthetase GluQRS [Mariprofundales bacterium]